MFTAANRTNILSFQHFPLDYDFSNIPFILKYESLMSNNLKFFYRTNCVVSKHDRNDTYAVKKFRNYT